MQDVFVFETQCLHSLVKVFPDEELRDGSYTRGSALRGETFDFQVAYRAPALTKPIRVSVTSTSQAAITLREVGLAPSELPCQRRHDDNVLRVTPGLYPDPLLPIDEEQGIVGIHYQWRAVWITVELAEETPAGEYDITVKFAAMTGEMLGEESFHLEVISAVLPPQTLIHTEWFHADCLANYYGVQVFSDEHWGLIELYLLTAVRHGMNMVLTPHFTPPLDTQVGGERLTVQLVDVRKEADGTYEFGFGRLVRWIELCDRVGIRYFEFSHLFTQWGAKHAPKVVAEERGELRRIFGWDTDATGEAYKSFLNQYLPALMVFLRERGLENRCYFHISDEPLFEHMPWYRSASELMQAHLGNFPIIDALTNVEYYEQGLVKGPIPANDHIGPFLERQVPELWTYYCCVQYRQVSNRFFNMPSARNRVIGVQLYKFQIAGFLHWGYNFWNTQYSLQAIDPYRVTDAGRSFPSGDAFLVYPGEEGPVESIRMEVFYEGLQDLRALQLLESLVGREQVLTLIEEGLTEPLSFSQFPSDAEWLLGLRERVNRAISGASASESTKRGRLS
ncbi:DUF4091 domain-containing protein [Paenibacillus oryzisoli]|uniref:Glycoside hydrolase 123 catalytic domain-containing protein n=1 Tax=Paenibacillus oryzisoli TaxID=1850517 RepID=A0A198A3R1_9BACL|nr:DUF4091 domain-containing protein [Paenibacillus oryzisoli]OAS15618.1 hypothetical protein A8708_03265 [Paenibacillus oryzisoli]